MMALTTDLRLVRRQHRPTGVCLAGCRCGVVTAVGLAPCVGFPPVDGGQAAKVGRQITEWLS